MKSFLYRALQLFVILGIPALGLLYFWQGTGQQRDVEVPFHSFQVSYYQVSAPGQADKRIELARREPVTVVNFWASWCPPCVEEFPAMIELQRQLEGKGVELVFVSVDEKWSDVEAFFQRNQIQVAEGRVYWDPTREMAKAWGSEKFPETYVLRRDGWVVEKIIGLQQWTRPSVVKYFQDLGEKFSGTTVSGLWMPTAYAQDTAPLQALIHEDDKKALEVLRKNVETASENLQKLEGALNEEQRNLQEQNEILKRRKDEESSAQKDTDKLVVKRREIDVLVQKNQKSMMQEDGEKKSLEKKIQGIETRIKQLQKELEMSKEELTQAQKALSTRANTLSTLEETKGSLAEEGGGLDKRVQEATKVLTGHQTSRRDAEEEVKRRTKKVAELTQSKAQAERVLSEQKKKLSEFEKALQR